MTKPPQCCRAGVRSRNQPKCRALSLCGKIRLPEEKNMRKLIVFSAAALLAGALAGGAQATPLSATGAMAMSGVADQSMSGPGVIKARWHRRHYGWSRGYHYGRRHHYSHRYANYRGSRNFQSQFSVEH